MYINNWKTELHPAGRRPQGAPPSDPKLFATRDPPREIRSRAPASHEHRAPAETGFGAQSSAFTTQGYPLARIRKLMELSHRYQNQNRSSPTAAFAPTTQTQMQQQMNASVHMRPLVSLFHVNQNPFGFAPLSPTAAPLAPASNGPSVGHTNNTAPASQAQRKLGALGVANAVDLESVSRAANGEQQLQTRLNPHSQLSLPDIPAYLMWNRPQNRLLPQTRPLAKPAPPPVQEQQPLQAVRVDVLRDTPSPSHIRHRLKLRNSNGNSKRNSPAPVALQLAEARPAVRVTPPNWSPEAVTPTPPESKTPVGGSAPPRGISENANASAAPTFTAPESEASSTLSRVAEVLSSNVHVHFRTDESPTPFVEEQQQPSAALEKPRARPSLTKAPSSLQFSREFTVDRGPPSKRPPPLKRTSISVLPALPGPPRLRKAKTSLNLATGSRGALRRSSFDSGAGSSAEDEGTPPPSTKHINCRRPLPTPIPLPRRTRRPSNPPPLPHASLDNRSTVSIAEETEDLLPHTPAPPQIPSANSTPICPPTPPPEPDPGPVVPVQTEDGRSPRQHPSRPKSPIVAPRSRPETRPNTGKGSARGNRTAAKSARRKTHNMLVVWNRSFYQQILLF